MSILKKLIANLDSEESKTVGDTLDKFSLLTTIYKKEKEDLMSRKIKKCLEQEFQLEQLGKDYQILFQAINDNKKLLKEKTATLRNNGFLWVTINPHPNVSLKEFVNKVHKIVSYQCIISCAYVFEQRGTLQNNNVGTGAHAHLLIRRNLNYKPSDVCRKIKRGAEKLTNVKNNNLLNLQIIGNEFARDKYKYIVAQNKTGLGKNLKQGGDLVFRKNNLLNDIYKKGDITEYL